MLLSALFCAAGTDAASVERREELLCRCLINAETLAHASRLAELFRDELAEPKMLISEAGNERSIYINTNTGRLGAARAPLAFDILQLASYLKLFSWLVGARIELQQIELQPFADPHTESVAQRLFGCAISSGCARSALVLKPYWIDRPVLKGYSNLKAILGYPTLALIPWPRTSTLRNRVMQLLDAHTNRYERLPSLDAAAALLCQSASTLRRQLARENTSFQMLKDELRERRSKTLLKHTDRTLEDIAAQLGLEGASSFSRAFRSWTGLSPTEFRLSSRAFLYTS
jgi:AraC-like DNA-binding protein